jgi:hypothetical protein
MTAMAGPDLDTPTTKSAVSIAFYLRGILLSFTHSIFPTIFFLKKEKVAAGPSEVRGELVKLPVGASETKTQKSGLVFV